MASPSPVVVKKKSKVALPGFKPNPRLGSTLAPTVATGRFSSMQEMSAAMAAESAASRAVPTAVASARTGASGQLPLGTAVASARTGVPAATTSAAATAVAAEGARSAAATAASTTVASSSVSITGQAQQLAPGEQQQAQQQAQQQQRQEKAQQEQQQAQQQQAQKQSQQQAQQQAQQQGPLRRGRAAAEASAAADAKQAQKRAQQQAQQQAQRQQAPIPETAPLGFQSTPPPVPQMPAAATPGTESGSGTAHTVPPPHQHWGFLLRPLSCMPYASRRVSHRPYSAR
jgi:hypothetical protein